MMHAASRRRRLMPRRAPHDRERLAGRGLRAALCGACVAIVASLADAGLPVWMADAEAVVRIEGYMITRFEAPGIRALAPTPDGEAWLVGEERASRTSNGDLEFVADLGAL